MVMVMSFNYRLEKRGGFYYVIALAASYCPICQSLLVMRATRQRVIWISEEVKKILVIRRLYCENCNRIHHELPDCLVPYKRYGTKIIESIAVNNTKDAPCPAGTVRRLCGWWEIVKAYGMNNNRPNEAIAFERYKIIDPILTAMEENADKGKIGFLKSEACGLAGVSRKTLTRLLDRYAKNGLDGLKYQAGLDVTKKLIPGELLKEAILLRREVPTRSVPQIIEILEMEGKAPKGLLKRSTLQDRLREAGYSSSQMKLYQQPGIAASLASVKKRTGTSNKSNE